ncbi:MAG: hypothetical protein ACRDKG_14730 [Actinomycetota bacterium]
MLRVSARVPLASNISDSGLALGGGVVWVTGGYDRGVIGIDVATGKLVRELQSPHGNIPGGGTAATVADSVWVAYGVATDAPDGFDAPPPPNHQTVYRNGKPTTADLNRASTTGGLVQFDPASGRLQRLMLFIDWSPTSIATTPGAVWLVVDGIARINPTSGEVVARLPVSGQLAAGLGSLWVAGDDLVRIDPNTNQVVARIDIPTARDIVVGDSDVWITTEDSVLRVDGATNRVTAAIAIPDPWGVGVDDGRVWVSGFRNGTLSLIDPKRNVVSATINLGGTLTDVLAAGDSAWVAFEPGDSSRSALVRVDVA